MVASGRDADRVLSDHGRCQIQVIASILRQRGVKPHAIISSTAARAEATASGLARGLEIPDTGMRTLPDLYLASPEMLLHVIQNLAEDADCVFVVGHNPGMHQVVTRLARNSPPTQFPTLSVAHFVMDDDYWATVEWGGGECREFLTPEQFGCY